MTTGEIVAAIAIIVGAFIMLIPWTHGQIKEYAEKRKMRKYYKDLSQKWEDGKINPWV